MVLGKKGQVAPPPTKPAAPAASHPKSTFNIGLRPTQEAQRFTLPELAVGMAAGAAVTKGAGIVGKGARFAVGELTSASNWFVIVAILVAWIDVSSGFRFFNPFARAMIYIGMWGVAISFVWPDKSARSIIYTFLLASAPFAAPFLINGILAILPYVGIAITKTTRDVVISGVVSIFSLFWVWLCALKGQKFAKFVGRLIVVAMLLFFAWQALKAIGPERLSTYGSVEDAQTATKEFYGKFIPLLSSIPNRTISEIEKYRNFTGGLIETETAKTIGVPYGVKFGAMRYAGDATLITKDPSPTYKDDGNIVIFAPLEVVTRKTITLAPFCRFNATGTPIEGTATIIGTSETIISEGLRTEKKPEIQCVFEKGKLSPKAEAYPLKIGVEFDWQTDAWLSVHFEDNDWAEGKRRQGKDPLDTYPALANLKRPRAITTPGPAELGISTTPQYEFPVSKSDPSLLGIPIVHLQLKRNKDPQFAVSVIKEIKSLNLQLPVGLRLSSEAGRCTQKFAFQGSVKEGEIEFNTYTLDEKIENIKEDKEIGCQMEKPTAEDARKLIGDEFVVTRTIRASALSTVVAERTVSITVRKS